MSAPNAVVDETATAQTTQAEPIATTQATEAPATTEEKMEDAPAPAPAVPDDEQAGKEESAAAMIKTTARINRKDKNANVKFDPSTLPVTDDHNTIRKQVSGFSDIAVCHNIG
jgi:lupus La protein